MTRAAACHLSLASPLTLPADLSLSFAVPTIVTSVLTTPFPEHLIFGRTEISIIISIINSIDTAPTCSK